MTNQLEALISSEIADFFAGVVEIHTELGGANTVEEAQQQLTERVTRIASECEAALIAAMESRTIEVFLPRKHQTSCSVDDIWYAPDEVHEAIRSAGGIYQESNDD